jgi:hypothetical protein
MWYSVVIVGCAVALTAVGFIQVLWLEAAFILDTLEDDEIHERFDGVATLHSRNVPRGRVISGGWRRITPCISKRVGRKPVRSTHRR